MSTESKLPASAYQRALELQRIGDTAARKAQAHNRSKGIPNFYSIAGRIVSDVPGAEAEINPLKQR
ncbi:MAG: hypothetical protein ACRCTU_06090 [Zoogloea sp.]|uniref:hypothetical protein n=1 Tax=Zoogloea sp. TaxID=49181 RepID=UPI003F3CE262|nr:hypothetical protein [Rhodocyclales bacterium]